MKRKLFFIALTLLALPLGALATSLWTDEGETFLDRKPRAVGDPITVVFNSKSLVRYQSRVQSATTRSKPQAQTGAPMLNFLPQIEFNDSDTVSAEKSTRSSSEFEGAITAEVVAVLETGNMQIAGTHTMSVDGMIETVSIGGVANPKKIKRGGLIYSTDLIRPTITYSGITVQKGARFNANDILAVTNYTYQTNIGSETIDGVTVPITNITTNERVSLEFSDVQKQRLIMEYLNRTLDALFAY